MTMPRVENWSLLRGRVQAVFDDPERSDFRRISVSVEGVDPVAGYETGLDRDAVGTTVDVAVPRPTADTLALAGGEEIEIQARSTPRGLFAHPDLVRVIPRA